MINKTKYFVIFFIGIMILNTACEDIFGSDESSKLATIEVLSGDKQTGHLGSVLNMPITIKGLAKNDKLLLKCKIFQGNGGLSNGIGLQYDNGLSMFIADDETASFKWRLGCDQENQKIKIYVHARKNNDEGFYDNSSGYYQQASDSIIIEAKGILKKGWNRSAGYRLLNSSRIKIFSHDDKTLFMITNYLYKSDDGGLNWTKVEDVPYNGYLFDAQFDQQGKLYVVSKDKGVCYTKDFKQWKFINTGFVKKTNPGCFLVKNDVMYVSFDGEGLYKTVNQGKFWEKLYMKENPGQINHIAFHPNGDIYIVEGYRGIWLSKNQGASWERIYLDDDDINYRIRDFKIDNQGYLYIGSHRARISKLSSENYKGESHSYYYWNSDDDQFVNNISFGNNDVYYLVNNMHYPGIYSVKNNWQLIDVEFKGPIEYYYHKSNGDYLLLKDNGLYYFHE